MACVCVVCVCVWSGQSSGHRGSVERGQVEMARGGGRAVVQWVQGAAVRCKGRKQTPAVSRKEMHYCSGAMGSSVEAARSEERRVGKECRSRGPRCRDERREWCEE